MSVRRFEPADPPALRRVFMSSIHGLAKGFYSREQLEAWAPPAYDARQWAARIGALRPYVAVVDGEVAGYADLQASGHIEHFFVAEAFSGRGVGAALMARIHRTAARRGTARLSACVSAAAEAFFIRHGFSVVQRQSATINGVSLDNALMARTLARGPERR
ncbi:GNAT family N-acetyltransferase [Pseudoxanthomonas sp. 10H]|uniref:GNAT family N-acetyltransferase n=1 Tax=Pseudoxanthomonas sp. 10H TaxID=3242729 RepID=UPI003556DC97